MKGLPRATLWPMAVAVAVRVAAWALISGARFASDEQGYVDAGVALAAMGQQDLFWPPMTGWIVALVKTLAPAAPLKLLRLLWVAIDIANVALVAVLAGRLRAAMALPAGFVTAATLGYALYLPAISHAQFVTSEIPSLFLVLVALVIVTSGRVTASADIRAGAVLGALALARANLLPLLILMPAAAYSQLSRSTWIRRTAVVAAIGGVIVAAAIARNWVAYGEPTLSRNAAYNLYLGNQDVYAEDLNLFSPRATPEQIEFRRQFFAGTLPYPTGTAAELQRAAMQWIAAHPLEFARRATGRLARLFAPKTDVLELVGGEAAAGVFSPRALTMLVMANIQWTFVLFGGLFGLAILAQRDRLMAMTFIATIVGSALLCLIAISKPRYSFVFDPLLIIASMVTLAAPAAARATAWQRYRPALIAGWLFLAWAWIAWTIFAMSSRLSP